MVRVSVRPKSDRKTKKTPAECSVDSVWHRMGQPGGWSVQFSVQ